MAHTIPSSRWTLTLLALLCAASAPVRAGTCMYGPDGSIVYRPDGAECRNVATTEPEESEFVAPRPKRGGAWLQIRPGDQQLFEVEITHGESRYGEPFHHTTYSGTQHREVVAAPKRYGSKAMERRTTLRVAEGGQDFARTQLERDFIRPTGQGYQLLAVNRFWFYRRQDVAYGDGALLLPARIGRGLKWNSGRIRDERVKIDEVGEVMGLEDVATPAGSFPKCLRVRYTGEIGGGYTRIDGRPAVVGRYVRDVWFARGVGIVREHEDGRLETIHRGEAYVFTAKYEAAIKGVKRSPAPASKK
jgi:hypothetical protein